MPIDIEEVRRVLAKENPENPLSALSALPQNASLAAKRSREETLMFLEEINFRYPVDAPPELITSAIKALNSRKVITALIIRGEISMAEALAGLDDTEPLPLAHPSPQDRFLELLSQRRGAYTWQAGTTSAFVQWVNSVDALTRPLPDDAVLNCWEAVLAAAAQAKLVNLTKLRTAYAQSNRNDAVWALLTEDGCTELSRPWKANNVNNGDIVMIESPDRQKLHHVVAIVTENKENLEMAQAMSLWQNVGGGGFTKATIQALTANDGAVLRYSTLMP